MDATSRPRLPRRRRSRQRSRRLRPPFIKDLNSMRRRAVAVLALLACGGASLGAQHTADNGPIDPGFDYHSYANIDQFRATQLELEMRVDLQAQTITGVAGFEFKRLDPRATQLVLDSKGLMINDVRQKATDVLGATAKNQTIW